ncbi:MAG TPA: hypothetical protein DCE41_36485 [Cytophagales bacterium]|nr:hypothetical protein [Cytophagales bacterium]HAA18352.1 hypothetical protein [Cytophagales bacterium]HAP60336.1 hypothetical protein [Cytophagales bacterium]
MRELIFRWLETGTRESNSGGLNNTIRISNFVGLFYATLIGVPFIIITFIFVRTLVWVPIGGTAMFLMILPFNHIELYRTSRIVLSLAPITLANIYSAYLLEEGQDLPESLALIVGCFVVMPFSLFEWADRKYGCILAGLGGVTYLLQPVYAGWFHLDTSIDLSIFESGPLRVIVAALALLCMGGLLLTLVYRNSVLENKWS